MRFFWSLWFPVASVGLIACGETRSSLGSTGTPSPGAGADASEEAGACAACAGTCSAGRCLVELASGQAHPYALAVDATSAYWTNSASADGGGAVMSVPLEGGPPTVLAQNQDWPEGIAVDATSVYWVNSGTGGGTVMKVPLAGGTPTVLAESSDPLSLAVDGESVYWTNPQGGTVMKVPLAGGTPSVLASPPSSQDAKLAIDGTSVYFTNFAARTVSKVSLSGGATTVLATDESADSIAVRSGQLYLDDDVLGGARILTMPTGGGDVVTLASGQDSPGFIAVDDASVYWATLGSGNGGGNPTGNDGTVMKVPLGGGPPTVLATGQALSLAVAVDSTSVYWVDMRSGKIMKLTPK